MDLDISIGPPREALDVPSADDGNQADRLHTLGLSYRDRYLQDRAEEDLEQAIQYLQKAVDMSPEDGSESAAWLYDLGVAYQSLFRRHEIAANIDIAIRHLQDAVDRTPVNHPERAKRLERLGGAYRSRYLRKGDASDIDAGLEYSQEAVHLTSQTEAMSDYSNRLEALGMVHVDRYRERAEWADVEASLRYFQELQHLTPRKDPHWPWRQDCLGRLYLTLYEEKGNEADLHTGIRNIQEGIELTSEDDSNWSSHLESLSIALRSRFSFTGVDIDLDNAIQYAQKALDATPDRLSRRASRLSGLGLCHEVRYLRKRMASDLDTAIKIYQEALSLTPEDHRVRAEKLYLVGGGHWDRFCRDKNQADMDTAIQYMQEALDLTPKKHIMRAQRLHDLAIVYQRQTNLEAAIPKFQEALECTAKDGQIRGKYLHSLGFAHQLRFTWFRNNEADLDIAIQNYHEGFKKMPKHHVGRAHSLIRLGSAYDARYFYKGDEADDIRAENAFKEAVHHSSSYIVDRLRACKQLFFSSVERERWQSAYEVASAGVPLLTQLAPRSLVTSDKQRLLIEFSGLARDAAAVALMMGKEPYEAVRLLEIGRGVITGSLNEIHTDVSELIQHYPQIAKEYVRLRDQMSLPAMEIGQHELLPTTASRASQRYDTGQKLERTIQTIRGLPNFDRFLMAPSEADLKAAAAAGPIIIINDSYYRCDALVITKSELMSIPLPQLKGMDMVTFANSLGNPQSMNTRLLEWLWDTVAEPVLDSLGLSQTEAGSLPRVWWIPTGRLARFPIHAAGYHLSGTQAVLDRVISSYAFSVRVLLQSRRVPSSEPPRAGSGKAVLVGMRETPRLSNLPFVPLEIDHLERICGSMQLKAFKPRPYRDDVLAALVDCDVFHFAGHGNTDRESPSQSSLVLLDGPLTVEELFNTSLHDRRPFLAYLSACGTGRVKDYRLLDEALHLIAAYQVSGFRHVIGTLWEVNDKSCVDAASMTYKWIQDQKMTDESVSEGLHRASVKLRGSWAEETVTRTGHTAATAKEDNCSRDVPLEHSSPDIRVGLRDMDLMEDLPLYWVPYVHFGI